MLAAWLSSDSRGARLTRALGSILVLTLVAAWMAFKADAWPSDAPWTRCLATGLVFHMTIRLVAAVLDRVERRGDTSPRASWTLVGAIALAIVLGGIGAWLTLYAAPVSAG